MLIFDDGGTAAPSSFVILSGAAFQAKRRISRSTALEREPNRNL
jgi:hypothetical protein